jgi:hypothetical protein
MKRTMITLILMVFSVMLFAQKQEDYKEPQLPTDETTKLITYVKVVEVTGVQDSLFVKGKRWFFAYYNNPTGVIREEKPEEGKILGKHQFKVLNPADKKGLQTMAGIVQYTVTVQVKENKARIVLTDFNLKANSYTPIEKWLDKNAAGFTTVNYFYLEQLDKMAKEILADFEKFITAGPVTKTDNW